VEVTVESGYQTLESVLDAARRRNHIVGAGTVTSGQQLRHVSELGAAFTVAPGVDESVIRHSRSIALPHLPGVTTPTEVQAARALGCSVVEVFPASVLGPAWIKAVATPFPDMDFVATGGINASNAAAFLSAGASGVAVGQALADPTELALLVRLLGRD
jgi:2-dehydro-3-deoxyphosphogluconate aldolase/(4S)-4-hydroxy-2-oxoglutarate aldolase